MNCKECLHFPICGLSANPNEDACDYFYANQKADYKSNIFEKIDFEEKWLKNITFKGRVSFADIETAMNAIRHTVHISELKGENKSEQEDTEFNHELFYEFLLNVINPNEMEKYRSMFLSSGEIVN